MKKHKIRFPNLIYTVRWGVGSGPMRGSDHVVLDFSFYFLLYQDKESMSMQTLPKHSFDHIAYKKRRNKRMSNRSVPVPYNDLKETLRRRKDVHLAQAKRIM